MKKTNAFILSFPLLLLFSCTASLFPDLQNDLKDLDAAPYSTHISIEKARQTVQDALDAMALQTKAGVGRTIAEGYLMDRSRMTKAAAEAPGDTIPPYYVFNFADDQGYALASVDSRMSPILCIIDQGHFSPDSALTNPGQIALLSRIETDYRMALGLPIEGPDGELVEAEQYTEIPLSLYGGEQFPNQWTMVSRTFHYRGIKLSTNWGQGYPYNALIYNQNGVRCPAGCVNIALAQVMNYHGLNFTVDDLYVDWDEINTVKNRYDLGTSTGLEMLQNYLAYAVDALHAYLTPTGTGIYTAQIPSYLQSLGYSSGGSKTSFWLNTVLSEISHDYPVLCEGYAFKTVVSVMGIPVNTYYTSGHEWVIDRSLEIEEVWCTIESAPTLDFHHEYLLHCNLGWDGVSDGYYLTDHFNTNSPTSYTDDEEDVDLGFPFAPGDTVVTVGQEWYYAYNLQTITGIRPVNNN